MIKLILAIVLGLSFVGTLSSAANAKDAADDKKPRTDIVRIDGTVFRSPDMRPASRVKDREHPTKRRTAKVRETGKAGQ